MKRTCQVCGKEFLHPDKYRIRKTCSDECRELIRIKYPKIPGMSWCSVHLAYAAENEFYPRQNLCIRCSGKLVKQWRLDNPERDSAIVHKSHIQRHYSMTPEEFAELVDRQQGLCAICRSPEHRGRRLSVDHDHATGRIRGLLCSNCNTGIGLLQDNPVNLRAAIAYLER